MSDQQTFDLPIIGKSGLNYLLYPNGKFEENKEHVSLYLFPSDGNLEKRRIEVLVRFHSSDDKPLISPQVKCGYLTKKVILVTSTMTN